MWHCSVQMDTWCAPAVYLTCWPTHVSRTRRRRVQDAAVRSVVHCAVATSPLRRQSRSYRHRASSVHDRCRARCYRDTSRRCASTGSLGVASPRRCCYYQCRCSRVIRCVWLSRCMMVSTMSGRRMSRLPMSLQSGRQGRRCWCPWRPTSCHFADVRSSTFQRFNIYQPHLWRSCSIAVNIWWTVDSILPWIAMFSSVCVCVSLFVTERRCWQRSRDDRNYEVSISSDLALSCMPFTLQGRKSFFSNISQL